MDTIDFFKAGVLVREAQRGNHAAFEKLAHAHDHSVLRLAPRITGSQSDAQYIYQETFLGIFKNLGTFCRECSFSTWIYRIATNVCLDHLRKENNRKEASAIGLNFEGEELTFSTKFETTAQPATPSNNCWVRN